MFELAGDLGLEHELGGSGRDGRRILVFDFLECDLAVELVVECDGDDAKAAAGVGPNDPEPAVYGCRFTQRLRRAGSGNLGLAKAGSSRGCEAGRCAGLDVGVGEAAEIVPAGPTQLKACKLLTGSPPWARTRSSTSCSEQFTSRLGEIAALDEQCPQRRFLADDPGIHRREQACRGKRNPSAPPECPKAGYGRRRRGPSWAASENRACDVVSLRTSYAGDHQVFHKTNRLRLSRERQFLSLGLDGSGQDN